MNKVVLVGNIVADAKYHQMQERERGVIRFILAVNKGSKRDVGRTGTYFISVIYWVNHGEQFCKYLTRGRLLSVSGKIISSSYIGSDGVKKYRTDVEAEGVQFLDSKKQNTV